MITSFDWLDDVETNFQGQSFLSSLKQDKFYGSITINFEAGIPRTVNFNRHLKAEANPNKGEKNA